MLFASNIRRKQNQGSAAAQKAVSPKRVRRRRQAQKRRKFSAAIRSIEAVGLPIRRLWPDLHWSLWRSGLPGFSGLVPSKALSFLLLLLVVAALYWMQASESFFVYREDMRFEGTQYLTDEELFAVCDVESWSIFWLEPEKIRAQVTNHPYVADAHVQIHWPAQITIAIQEVRPVALWATEQQEYWLLEDGTALAPKEAVAQPIVRVIDPSAAARIENIHNDLQINDKILTAAIALSDRLLIVKEFWYNSDYGLNFSLPSTLIAQYEPGSYPFGPPGIQTRAWVYWGDGRKFDKKWTALQASMSELATNWNEDIILNLMTPNRPFIRRYISAPAGQ